MLRHKPVHAALYMRASTEHQNYSTSHQELVLREYASKHGYDIVGVYRDEGRSGLTIEGRDGLIQLLTAIAFGRANFTTLLIYDVSRWGRFQDADEPAHYEFACRRAGIDVRYCAEPFQNNGGPMDALLKSLKRTMAAEYSRELSDKVTLAQRRFVEEGFKQGGSAGFGLRRIAVSASGEIRRVLEPQERKGVPTDRVTFTRGPDHEVEVVLRIYAMYLDDRLAEMAIAERLNSEGLRTDSGRHWQSHNVKSILTREKYAGTIVFNRSTQKMRTPRRQNAQAEWIRHEDAFHGIVTRERFEAAQAERARRRRVWSDDEMLDGLRDIVVKHGRVTPELINLSMLPGVKSYVFRFNGLVAALDAAEVAGTSLSRATITRFRTYGITKERLLEVEHWARLAGAEVERIGRRTYRFNDVTARLLCTRCRFERSYICWKVLLRQLPQPDFIIWLRMDDTNARVAQVYLLPVADFPDHKVLWPSSRTLDRYEKYARASIADLFGMHFHMDQQQALAVNRNTA
jgi:DNA invertase Pin-like site-specific DNA recombinase